MTDGLKKQIHKTVKVLNTAYRSLYQRKLRSMLSMLGVICGVTAVLSMISIGEGARQEVISQIGQLGTNNIYIKSVSLTREQQLKAREKLSRGLGTYDVERIKKGCRFIDDVGCIKELSASIIGSEKEVLPQMIACSANTVRLLNLSMADGRFFKEQDIDRRNKVCVLGSSIDKSLGDRARPGSFLRIENHLLKVVGTLGKYDIKTSKMTAISIRNYNEMVFIPLGLDTLFMRAGPAKEKEMRPELSEIVIRVKETDRVLHAAGIIKRIMEIAHHGVNDYQVVIPQELLKQSRKTQRIFNIVLGAIAGISLLVGGIGIMNIMLATVSERTREIGIRRAVGATRKHIIVQFLAESVILTFAGGIIGIAAGMGSVLVITAFAGWKTAVTTFAVLMPLMMSVLVGLFFGLYPAYKASRMNPIEALRHD